MEIQNKLKNEYSEVLNQLNELQEKKKQLEKKLDNQNTENVLVKFECENCNNSVYVSNKHKFKGFVLCGCSRTFYRMEHVDGALER